MTLKESMRLHIFKTYTGFDLTRDYFTLLPLEISEVEDMRKVFGFKGDNYLGRSKSRQFWYYLQRLDRQEKADIVKYDLPF